MQLIDVCDSDVPIDKYKNFKTQSKVVRIIDGDTLVLVFLDENNTLKKRIARLNGIDAAEMHVFPMLARQARNYLVNVSTDIEEIDINDMRSSREMQADINMNKKILWCVFDDVDKYGRSLVELYYQEDHCVNYALSINRMLVNAQHAIEYNGGKKM
jgi:endonuclease YncB( thermonuclease family)